MIAAAATKLTLSGVAESLTRSALRMRHAVFRQVFGAT